eukprot:Nitzschia sp. Nitz4//scaffold68_size99682//48890//50026//NITZ4_004566-RA/size99682-processed-gene-0.22-mRNA-1//1//CDS//3329556599//8823//frame0
MAAQQNLDTCRTGPVSLLVYDEEGSVSVVPYTNGADGEDSHGHRKLLSSTDNVLQEKEDASIDSATSKWFSTVSSTSKTGVIHALLLSQSQVVPPRQLATNDVSSADFETDYYDFDNSDGNMAMFCPTSADYCSLMNVGDATTAGVSRGRPIGCYPDYTVSQIVSRHVLPLVLIWYVGVVVFCVFTIHGPNVRRYASAIFTTTYMEAEADRLMAGNNVAVPPSSNWHCLAWQRYQYEYNVLEQTRWITRREERAQQADQEKESLPFELKIKAFHADSETDEDSNSEKDDASQPDIACTICFVPFQDGDTVGNIACGHLFHKHCLKAWCLRKNSCPLCNSQLATVRQTCRDVEQQVCQDPASET